MARFAGWEFLEFLSPSGEAPFTEWIASVPEARDFIDTRLLTMRNLYPWSEKWVSSYRGAPGIVELRITHKRVQYRPLGVYAPEFRFVLLGGGKEKGQLPPHLIDAVLERKRLLEEHPEYVRRYSYSSE